MAGVKGKSGRKPRNDGKKMRAVNLYIPMKETYGWNDDGKIDWIPETWFLQFKRIFGPRWQEQVRKLKWHRSQEADCSRCGYEPYELERYRSQQQARIHARDAKPQQSALSVCPVCKNPLTLEVDLHGRKMMRCMKC